MAVIAKYVVVRNGVELEQTFTDKKEAEAYDNMLDAAEGLSDLIKNGDHGVDLEPKVIDEIALILAKNAAAVTTILKAVKPVKPAASSAPKKADADANADVEAQAPEAKKQGGRASAKNKAA